MINLRTCAPPVWIILSIILHSSPVASDGENIHLNFSPVTLLDDSPTSARNFSPVNQSIPVNSDLTDHSQWSPSQPLPPTINRPLSHCNLRPVNWFNYTQGELLLPLRPQIDELFHSTQRKHQVTLNQRLKSVSAQHLRFTKLPTHDCYLLFLYATTCRFSVAAFPYVRALARAYPQLYVYGIRIEDYMAHRWSLRMLFVPKLKLVVDGRVLREYPGSDTDLNEMIDFVWLNTRQLPKGPVGLVPADHSHNPPKPAPRTDVCLIAAWTTVLFSLFYLGFVCWDLAIGKVMGFAYRMSRGRFGRPNSSSTSHAGPILGWVPGQITPVN